MFLRLETSVEVEICDSFVSDGSGTRFYLAWLAVKFEMLSRNSIFTIWKKKISDFQADGFETNRWISASLCIHPVITNSDLGN